MVAHDLQSLFSTRFPFCSLSFSLLKCNFADNLIVLTTNQSSLFALAVIYFESTNWCSSLKYRYLKNHVRSAKRWNAFPALCFVVAVCLFISRGWRLHVTYEFHAYLLIRLLHAVATEVPVIEIVFPCRLICRITRMLVMSKHMRLLWRIKILSRVHGLRIILITGQIC